jgi:adenylate cyclase
VSPTPREARDAGQQTLAALRKRIAERLIAGVEQRDPVLLASLAEVGILNRAWVEDPGKPVPMSTPPVEMLERLLERSVEQKPTLLASLGLSAIQLLAASGDGSFHATGTTEHLAVAFTDLEGFTRFTAREGDEAAGALLAGHHRVVGPIVRSRGGHIVKRLGDGLLLTFPQSGAAVLAGLELVEAEPGPLRLRAGINVGDVQLLIDDVIGHEVNVAARVAEAAKGGQVLITGNVRTAAMDGDLTEVTFGRLRRRRFKGLPEPIAVCRVSRRSSAPQAEVPDSPD